MGKDVLDWVLLSPNAVNQWNKLCQEIVRDKEISDPYQIPDEKAEVMDDGRLRIYCELPGYGEVEMFVEKREWGWNN